MLFRALKICGSSWVVEKRKKEPGTPSPMPDVSYQMNLSLITLFPPAEGSQKWGRIVGSLVTSLEPYTG